jgi:histo-blood group ABO system transferase
MAWNSEAIAMSELHCECTGNTFDITFLVISTGKYIEYARVLISSINTYVDESCKIQVLVFTDQKDQIPIGEFRKHLLIETVTIEHQQWPMPTLLRYDYFRQHWSAVKGELVMYLDADTVLRSKINRERIVSALDGNEVALVRHPGYYNRGRLFRGVTRAIRSQWETRPASAAFIPRDQRKDYVCGGVWMGTHDGIHRLCRDLSNAVQNDLDKNLIAKFHDESHLNRWRIDNQHALLTPEWAFASGYKGLSSLSPIIEVVHKPAGWTRN